MRMNRIPSTSLKKTFKFTFQQRNSLARLPFNLRYLPSPFIPCNISYPAIITRSFTNTSHSRTTKENIQNGLLNINLSSSENASSSIPLIWLRDNCQCHQCVDPHSKQKLHSSGDIDLNPEIHSFKETETEFSIVWIEKSCSKTNEKSDQQLHESLYKKKWVSRYFPSGIQEFRSKLTYNTWDSKSYQVTYTHPISFSEFSKESGFIQALQRLTESGLCLLRDVPTDDVRMVESVAQKFGSIMNTFYGISWDVKSIPKAKNIAYTSVHLGLHMDLLYYGLPPGLQFLHCLKNNVQGGHSIFLDSFKAVEILKKKSPESYKILCSTPVTFHYRNDGHDRHYRHFTIDDDPVNGDLSVNYAPPFQGPLEMDNQHCTPQQSIAFYRAMKEFESILQQNELIYETKMGPGDLVIFVNRRVLHGRTAFDGTTGERHLRGTYVGWDDFKDKVRFHL